MRAVPVAAILTILLVLLGAELLVASTHANIMVAPAIGFGMAVVVALGFMRLISESALPRVFALAALFWLIVLIGMGSLDSATRHDIGVALF